MRQIIFIIMLSASITLGSKINTELLYGVWKESGEVNSSFQITPHSIIYTENQTNPLKFEIVGDTLVISLDTFTVKERIVFLSKDSLVLHSEIGLTHYVKLE